MDRKSIIILIVCFALLLLWGPLVRKLYPPKPLPPGATNVESQVQTSTPATPPITITSAPPSLSAGSPLAVVKLPLPADSKPVTLQITNESACYTFTSHGGGLESVELLHFPETVTRSHKQSANQARVATLNTAAPVPVMALLDGAMVGDGVFELTRTAKGVRAEKALTNGLVVVKEFELSTNYLVVATVWLENQSGETLALPAQEWVVGTATPMGPDDDGTSVGMMWYNGGSSQDINAGWFANRTLGCLPGTPRPLYVGGQSNVVWVAAHNQHFGLLAMPREPAQQVLARMIELPRPAGLDPRDYAKPLPKGYVASFLYPPVTLAAGQKSEQQVFIFAGPKEYRTLAKVASQFNNNADVVMGFGGFFGFFSKGLLLAMNWLHDTFKLGYGLAIIAITVIIKTLFWPLTQASTRSMKRMAALQPQMKALQAKYKDDPAKMNKKMMEFWKENKVNPMGGCLPMVLQMPVFIGFFYMIRSAIELRGASFLWIADLSKPDTLFMIPGLNFPFNLLPLLMGATMLWQSHLTPPSPGMDPMQQKMMRYMPLIFLFMLYNFSAGLTLYWTVQNLLSIAQMKLTKTTQPVTAVAPVAANALPPKKWK